MIETISLILIFGSLFLYTPHAKYHEPRWHYFTLLAMGFFSYHIALVSNVWFGLFYFWLLWPSAFNHYDYCPVKLSGESKMLGLFISEERGKTASALFAIGLIFIFLSQNILLGIVHAVPFLLFIDAIIHFIPKKYRQLRKVLPPNTPESVKKTSLLYGLCGNSSTTSTTLSILFAMMLVSDNSDSIKLAALISMLWSLYNLKGTAGILGFLGSTFLYLFYREQYEILAILAIITAVFAKINWKYLATDSGRIEIYKQSLQLHKNWFDRILGIGNGAFKVLNPIHTHKIAQQTKTSQNLVIWQHNDILQLYIESGIVGCLLCLAFLISIIPNFGITEWTIFITLIPNLAFNFPVHSSETIFIIIICLRRFFDAN